jgi:hypothetical protein
MSNGGATTPAAASASHGRGHRSGEIILHLLGGLVVAGLVTTHYDFLEFLGRGCDLQPGDAWVQWAYVAFSLNVFRQVHGLAIVSTDEDLRSGRGIGDIIANASAFAALVAVVVIPAFLLVEIEHWRKALASESPVIPDGTLVLNIYLWVAAAYVVWDTSSFFRAIQAHPTKGSPRMKWFKFVMFLVICLSIGLYVGFRLRVGINLNLASCYLLGFLVGALCGTVFGRFGMGLSNIRAPASVHNNQRSPFRALWDSLVDLLKAFWNMIKAIWNVLITDRFTAHEMQQYVLNWQAFLLLTLSIGVWLLNGKQSIPKVLTMMCLVYTTLDYSLNRKFYFSS